MSRIRVMIVEDSGVVRPFLEHMIGSDPRLMVVASVDCAEEALRRLTSVSPDVISMDIHLPGMNGLDATRKIMEERPTPIVVVSGNLPPRENQGTLTAIKAGALAIVEKPVGTSHADYQALAERLCTQLAIMSQVKVVRQRFNARSSRIRGASQRDADAWFRCGPPDSLRMIGIVASTGGPKALQTVLGTLPASFPVPIVLVQHISANFHQGFVSWLDQTCPLAVVTPRHREIAVAGHVYVAPPNCHLEVNGPQLLLRCGNPFASHCPSGNVLLESMAASLKDAAAGVVLTGMGEDGADGLLRLRQAGGYTITQDEATAVVFGMPAAAARLGAVCEQLPLGDIGPRLLHLAGDPAEEG